MPVRPTFDPDNLYLITATAVHRFHLFARPVVKRIIIDSLNYMRRQSWINLYVFVVMPNHVHLIVRFHTGHTLSSTLREAKRHTARQIIRQYQAENKDQALTLVEKAASCIPDQRHKVWQDGYDARDIFSDDFLRQRQSIATTTPVSPTGTSQSLPSSTPGPVPGTTSWESRRSSL